MYTVRDSATQTVLGTFTSPDDANAFVRSYYNVTYRQAYASGS